MHPRYWRRLLGALAWAVSLAPALSSAASQPFGSGLSRPDVTWNPVSQRYLVLTIQFPSSGNATVFGQLLDASGAELAVSHEVIADADADIDFAVAATHPDGGFVVAYNASGTEDTIRVTRLDATGKRGATVTALRVAGEIVAWPAIAHSATSGRYAIAGMVTSRFPPTLSASLLREDLSPFKAGITLPVVGAVASYSPLEALDIAWEADRDAFAVSYLDEDPFANVAIAVTRLFADSSTASPFLVVDPGNNDAPGLAYDPARKRFVVGYSCNPIDDPEVCVQGFDFDGNVFPDSPAKPVTVVSEFGDDNMQGIRRTDIVYDAFNDRFRLATVADRGNGAQVFTQTITPDTLAPLEPLPGRLLTTVWTKIDDVAFAVNPACDGAVYTAGFDNGQGALTAETLARVTQPCPPPAPQPPATTAPVATTPAIQVDAVWPGNSTSLLNLGTATIGDTVTGVIRLKSTGSATLNIGMIASNDTIAAPFSLQTDDCSSKAMAPGENCTLTIAFSPAVTGVATDTFDIPSDATATPLVLWNLRGTAVAPANQPPTAPELRLPLHQATVAGPDIELLWTSEGDPDGDEVVFDLYWCPVSDFSGCEPVRITAPLEPETAKNRFPLLPVGGALVFAGLAIPLRRRPAWLCALLIVTGGCSELKKAFELGLGNNQKLYGYTLTDIDQGTTLYWKVDAMDPSGERATSEVWSFTVR
ncbi:MAG: choice-of-anchor D domain-containing protein [Candidatus Dadabacteria bacterium]|nr:MAG: choice-of-anchor D domain-containing protein [Candidatus Dadabacteria bacterium]